LDSANKNSGSAVGNYDSYESKPNNSSSKNNKNNVMNGFDENLDDDIPF
jgi:single-stranded DNA-binding protein